MAGDDAVPDIDDLCRSVEADRPAVEVLACCHVHRAGESRTPVVGDGVGHRPAVSGWRRCHRHRRVGDGAGCGGRGEGGAGGVGQCDGEGFVRLDGGVGEDGHVDLLRGHSRCEGQGAGGRGVVGARGGGAVGGGVADGDRCGRRLGQRDGECGLRGSGGGRFGRGHIAHRDTWRGHNHRCVGIGDGAGCGGRGEGGAGGVGQCDGERFVRLDGGVGEDGHVDLLRGHSRCEGQGAGGRGVVGARGGGAVGGGVADGDRCGRRLGQRDGECGPRCSGGRRFGRSHIAHRDPWRCHWWCSDRDAIDLQVGDCRAGTTGGGLESERRGLAGADLAVPVGVGHHVGGADMAGDDAAPEVGDFRRGVEADRPAIEGGLAGCHIHGADESGAPVVPGAVGHRGVGRHGCRGGDRTGHGERAAGAAADIAARQRQRCGDEIQRSHRCAGALVQRPSGRCRQETGDGGRRACQRHRHRRGGRGAADIRRGQDRVIECGSR